MPHRTDMLRIGTAGWTIPGTDALRAPGPGSHLERYARVFPCLEINSSFHRSHRLSTWERWAVSTPAQFRFSVKLPKTITHVAKLAIAPEALDSFAEETAALGEKFGVILVQLPPSLALDGCPATEFFEALRHRFPGHPIALEPRHASWFSRDGEELLHDHHVARVAADPLRDPKLAAGEMPQPGGWRGLTYYRLHGSPRMYYSAYASEYLAALAKRIGDRPADHDTWVMFDNTAAGQAFGNAFELQTLCEPKTVAGAVPEASPKKQKAQPKPRPRKSKV